MDTTPVETDSYQEPVYSRNNKKPKNKKVIEESDLLFDDEVEPVKTLPKGYYVLNKKASRLAGTPKYVFIAEEP